MMTLQKCLIANRGEIAVRIIRACRELGMGAVAVYSDVDAHARHVQLADEACLLGAAAPGESYLNIEKLIEVAVKSGCDCVHPGYGFLSESEDFAQAVLDAGLTWIGPPPDAIRAMGVKTEARALMQQAGVPFVPGFQSQDADDDAFVAAAEEIGYPVMVKAAGGGGGKGIRVVHQSDALVEALGAARREAQHAFGDPRLFLEKFIESARHIEIQVLADTHGHVIHLFERECSAQRRHQKIVEESPSPLLTSEMREQMGQAAVNAARAVGYVNAGTVEFVATPDGRFYFLEMNTRLQVEHPVTELVTGLDLVHWQVRIAAGERLTLRQEDIQWRGAALECRIYAEDPENHFFPSPGRITQLDRPSGPGIRLDSGVYPGWEVPMEYDPLLAKLAVWSEDRQTAIERMLRALEEYYVAGIKTNLSFFRQILDDPEFRRGHLHTGFIDEFFARRSPESPDPDLEEIAMVMAAIHASRRQSAVARPAANDSRWRSAGREALLR